MKLHFFKLDGAGNDFVGLDRRGAEPLDDVTLGELTRALCHRQRGIGADGVLVIGDSRPGVDFAMRYINADGSIGEMCGNGARCISVLAYHLGAAPEKMTFQTDAGTYRAEIVPGGSRVAFPDVDALPQTRILQGPLHAGMEINYLVVGVPHAVLFVEELDLLDVAEFGREVRYDPAFSPRGTNANFAAVQDGTIYVRTYERGVEAETLACGTGSVATVCCHLTATGANGPARVRVIPTGGDILHIEATPTGSGFTNIVLEGPARIVFQGDVQFDKGQGVVPLQPCPR